VSSAKRLIGRYSFSEEVKKAKAIFAYEIVEGPNHSVRIQIRQEEFSLPEVSAMVLREMKQIAEARLNAEITKAVVTVPAYFNDNQRQATKDAGRIAGLEVLRILNEPTAAALSYGFGRGLEQRVAVYDLGGGTFDISVLEIGTDVFEVLSSCGDTFLGGDDFDDRIIDLLADEFVAKEGINPRNDRFAFEKLKVAAESAKIGLSVEDEVEVRIPDVLVGEDGEPRSLERKVTQAEFGALVQDLVQRTFKVCDEALQQADLTARDLDGVIMVGGPTRLPIIRQAVRDYFQMEPKANVDPDEVVAMGAAIHAASLVTSSQDSYLLDVTPLDLRIGVAGGLAEPVIESNTPVPIEQSRSFSPFKDYQESVQIRVYQGDSRQSEDNELLGHFEFSGFQPGRRSDVAIEVSFEINADGIVNVTASDPVTGQNASTCITLSSGLSDDELQSIIDKDRAADVQTDGLEGDSLDASADSHGDELVLLEADEGPGLGTHDEGALDEGALESLGGEDDLEILCDDTVVMDNAVAIDDLSGDPGESLIIDDSSEDPGNTLATDDSSEAEVDLDDVDLDDLVDLEEDANGAPQNAIGRIRLQTVKVASPDPPMVAPQENDAPEDLFDLDTAVDLSGPPEEEV
jgi:molecular chaperone DnaK